MKTNSQIIFMSLLFATAAALSNGCSVHASSDPIDVPAPKPLDAGLEGTWATGCKYQDGMYQTETVVFHGSTFEDNVTQYTNSSCSGTPYLTAKVPGTFTVVDYSYTEMNGYKVNVVMTNPSSGAAETHYFTTVVEGSTLYLPDPSYDTQHLRPSYVDRTRPYTKIGG